MKKISNGKKDIRGTGNKKEIYYLGERNWQVCSASFLVKYF